MNALAALTRDERRNWGLAAGLAMLASLAAAPDVIGLMGGGLALIMTGIAIADRRAFTIPDEFSAAAFALGLCHAAFADPFGASAGVMAALARAGCTASIFLIVYVVYLRLRGREGVGLGDVKLAGVAGAWLNWPFIPVAIEIGALAALAAYVVRQRSRARPLRSAAKLPLGLFFAPSIWLCWLMETTLLNV